MHQTFISQDRIEQAIRCLQLVVQDMSQPDTHGQSTQQATAISSATVRGAVYDNGENLFAGLVGQCLEGALNLLATAHGLMDSSHAPSQLSQVQGSSQKLAAQAVNVLQDPKSVEAQILTVGVSLADGLHRSPQDQLDAVKEIFFKHWCAIQGDKITASEFTDYLRPLADLDGVTVSHQDIGVFGDHLPSTRDSHIPNALTPSIPSPQLRSNSQTTMTFALNREGRVSIQNDTIMLADRCGVL